MAPIRRFVARLLAVIPSRSATRDLNREMAAHLALLEDELQRRGMTPEEAHREARLRFGGIDSAVESQRDARSFAWVENLIRDCRLATRTLVRTPVLTAIAVITLAIGIGANTAIFSIVNAVILRPLPYPHGDRLVAIWEAHRTRGRSPVAPANLVEYARGDQSLVGVEGYGLVTRTLTGFGTPEQIVGEAVTANMFTVRGIQPAMGRAFLQEEDQPGQDHVVILTDRFWRTRLGGDPEVLTRTLTLDGLPHSIVGVMPSSACACSTDFRASVDVAFLKPAAYSKAVLGNHGNHVVDAVGRLREGVTLAQAQAELDVIMGRLATEHPNELSEFAVVIGPLQSDLVRDVQSSLLILLGAVALVLLVACVNVANLLFARALNQQREIAVRRALGATRGRIIMEATIRSLLLSLLGGMAGLVLGVFVRNLLVSFAPVSTPRIQTVTLDGTVLAATGGLALMTGLFAGMLPAWSLSRDSTATALRAKSGAVTRSVVRWRAILMIAEVAAAIILATGAGLLIRSFNALSGVDLGFQTEKVLTFRVPLPAGRYPDARSRLTFFESLADRIGRQPGAEAIAFANRFPLLGGWGGNVSVQTPVGVIEAPEVGLQAVSPAYFSVLNVALIRGRLFSADDREGAMPVAVVNTAFARTYGNGRDPIGWQLTRGNPPVPSVTIVGIVNDIRRGGKTEALDPQVYFPAAQMTSYDGDGGTRLLDVAVKITGNPTSMVPVLRGEIAALDSNQAMTNVKTLDDVLSSSFADRQYQLGLMASFAIVAIGLAFIGVYGVVSYAMTQRAHEIGIRLALGATRRNLVLLLVGRGLAWALIGVTFGLVGALGLTRVMKSLLFQIEPTDLMTLLLAPAGVFFVVGLACYIPARRAARLDPLTVLRAD